jgi:HTH-type transcriptional regulator / antitoxin HigA
MENRTIESFPPGEYIKDELEARGWTQGDLARIMGRQDSVVSAIINGKRSVSSEIASELASAFGTSAEVWLNLQTSYDLASKPKIVEEVSRRAKLFAVAPVKDMIRRGWIRGTDDLGALERQVVEFLNEPIAAVSFHKPKPNADITPTQRAWLCRARRLARGLQAEKFSRAIFARALNTLKKLMANPEDTKHVARVLAEGGVRFLIVEALPQTSIDGACFWLDESSPVIALTMRYDRIDNFWYILGHECGHVENEDGIDGDILDLNLVGDERIPFEAKSEKEKRADRFAEEFLVHQLDLQDFIDRKAPAFSKQLIRGFAMRMKVHPGIVLGQLQYRGEVGYFHSREMLVKVRDVVTQTALTDGFGHIISLN